MIVTVAIIITITPKIIKGKLDSGSVLVLEVGVEVFVVFVGDWFGGVVDIGVGAWVGVKFAVGFGVALSIGDAGTGVGEGENVGVGDAVGDGEGLGLGEGLGATLGVGLGL